MVHHIRKALEKRHPNASRLKPTSLRMRPDFFFFLCFYFTCHLLLARQVPEPPPYQALRHQEDYTYLRKDTLVQPDFWDPIKFIPLNQQGSSYLTFGGEVRYQYEYFRNPDWGEQNLAADRYLLQRYMAHSDLHLGKNFRLFGQLKSGLVDGKKGELDPPDKDRLDLHQAFADLSFRVDPDFSATLRSGRQEMSYGNSRFVSIREGPNVRLSFDAVKLMLFPASSQVDLFISRPVTTDPGIFDDQADPNEFFWGLYSKAPFPALLKGNVDLYAFGLEKRQSSFNQGTAYELRHVFGARWYNEEGTVPYDLEGQYQFGEFGSGRISAWTLVGEIWHTLEQVRFEPELHLRVGVISGDRNPADEDLQTFNPLYPKGSLFGQMAQVGPTNLIEAHPRLRFHFLPNLTVLCRVDLFWRQSLQDGVYIMPYNLLIPSGESEARHIGNQLAIESAWQLNRQLSLQLFLTYFEAGAFLRQSGARRDITFVAPRLRYRF